MSFSNNAHLKIEDVGVLHSGFMLSVFVLKTIRFIGNRIELPLPGFPNRNPLCPTAAVNKLLGSSGAKPEIRCFVIAVTRSFVLCPPIDLTHFADCLTSRQLTHHQYFQPLLSDGRCYLCGLRGYSLRRSEMSWELEK